LPISVRNTRLPATMGDERANGTAAFQRRFFVGLNSTGRPVELSTPAPFGPRKRGQSAACRAAIRRSPGSRDRIDRNGIKSNIDAVSSTVILVPNRTPDMDVLLRQTDPKPNYLPHNPQ